VLLDPPTREVLFDRVARLLDEDGGRVTVPYVTHLFLARRSRASFDEWSGRSRRTH
jgi:hypothetical protein